MSRCVDSKGFTTVPSRNNSKPIIRQNNNNNNNNAKVTKFCSVCKNAGKDEKIYTSHFPKSSSAPDAIVICPTILSNECSYCHKLGHYKQQCPVLESKKNGTFIQKPKENIEIKPVINKNENIKKFTTKFSVAFDSDSESDSELNTVVISENIHCNNNIPRLGNKIIFTNNYPGNKWDLNPNPKQLSLQHPDEIFVYIPSKEMIEFIKTHDINHDWADDEYWNSDSDDE